MAREKKERKPKKRKMRSIRKQTLFPLIFLSLLTILYNGLALAIYFSSYYFGDRCEDADRVALYAVAELESYRQIDWLFDYWDEHADEMELLFDEDIRYYKKEKALREQCPTLTELKLMSDEERVTLNEEGERLYAELCYTRLCKGFDRIKTVFDTEFLFTFRVRGNEIRYFVTGTRPGEVRVKNATGDDIYQLGSVSPYREGMFPAMDRILATQERAEGFNSSLGNGKLVTDVYEPVRVAGKPIAYMGVSINASDLTQDILGISGVVMSRTFISMCVMMILITVLLWWHILRPLRKEQLIIRKYEQDKDRQAVSEALETIDSRNELEELAVSFSSMTAELDRYMREIVASAQEKERRGAELAVAARIQAGALPVGHFTLDGPLGIDINASVKPAREVAGDFYDHFRIDEDHIGLTVADVSDKGIPASLFMMLSKALIKNVAMVEPSPARVVERVNQQLCANNPESMFVTVWFAIYDIPERKLVYVNAGHEHPAICRAETGQYELIVEPHDPVMGLYEEHVFTERTLMLRPGDRIFLYTDGVPEATAADKSMYGTDRMIECLNRDVSRSGEEVLAAIVEDTGAFVGETNQFDDMTMMLLEITGTEDTDNDAATHS